MKVFLVMPAYNEASNIESVIDQWHRIVVSLVEEGHMARLVIANDGSKDSTFEKMSGLSDRYPYLLPIDKSNSGHGATVMFLYHYAVDNGADFIFQTDSDGQTEPSEFWEMWSHRDEYDLQVGHRHSREDGPARVVVTKVLKGVVRLCFGVSVVDANTPFRLMRVSGMTDILDFVPRDFFLSNVAISAIAVKKRRSTRWIPVTFRPRQGDVSSINLRSIFRIGCKAVGDLYRLNRALSRKEAADGLSTRK